MKIKIKHTTEEEVELTLPAYRKTAAHQTKIISETTCIVVCRGWKDKTFGIECREYNIDYWVGMEESTEEEFTEWFNITVDLIRDSIKHHAVNDEIAPNPDTEFINMTEGLSNALDILSQKQTK